jgi:hypothetical protein
MKLDSDLGALSWDKYTKDMNLSIEILNSLIELLVFSFLDSRKLGQFGINLRFKIIDCYPRLERETN